MAKILGTTLGKLKAYDSRPPVSELKRLANSNPVWGLALRSVLKMNPEDLIKYANGKTKRLEEAE